MKITHSSKIKSLLLAAVLGSGGVGVDSFSWTLNILILRSPQCPRHVRPIRLNFAIR